jgi:hypothetical protein
MPFGNPIMSGPVLVRNAMQSENYVAGVSGWMIARDGSFEFSGGTFRGTVVVDGPNNTSIEINPSNGDPVIYFWPDDVGPPAATQSISPGVVYVFTSDFATQRYSMIMASPNPNGGSPAQVILTSSDKAASVEPTIELSGIVTDLFDNQIYLRGQCGTGSAPVAAAAATIVTAGTTFAFPIPFPVGVVPNVHINMNNNAVNTATWNARAVGISNTGFDIRAAGTAPGGVGFTLGFQYLAVID